MSRWQTVGRIKFEGERFQRHAIDLGSLVELIQFQRVVTATAKALWRNANSDRTNLPAGFESKVLLYFRNLEKGSVQIPLVVESESAPLNGFPHAMVDVIDAMHRTYEAVHCEHALPEGITRDLVGEYSNLGASLNDDEAIRFAPEGKNLTSVTKQGRERLMTYVETPHEDVIDVVGCILEADVQKKKFQLWTDATTKASAAFTDVQEDMVTTALKEHKFMNVRVRGRGEFDTQGGLKKITEIDSLEHIQRGESAFDEDAPDISKTLHQIFSDVAEEEWEELPTDLAKNLDHYLYGVDKK